MERACGPGQHFEEPPRDRLALPAGIAANEDVRVNGLGSILQHHRPRRSRRMRRIELLNGSIQLRKPVALRLIQEQPRLIR